MALADRLSRVQQAVAAACARRGRNPDSVRILAATKTVPADRLREAYALGLRHFGENRVQEAEAKRPALADLDVEWRLLGKLQSNKAAKALALFQVIESLDSLALARRLDNLAHTRGLAPVRVLMEINIGREPQKAGVAPEAALDLALVLSQLTHVRLTGVMAVPPAAPDPEAVRPHFAALATLSDEMRLALGRPADGWELSMGMSHDFEVAVEEGATEIRLGSILFGARPPV